MSPSLSGAKYVIRVLKAFGHEATLAGGCVRDQIMGRQPKDYDIATSATPSQVRESFPRTETVGESFGVILVVHEGAAYEVATFRNDGEYRDGRRPESVTFSSPEQDALRRDFTVNGLFQDGESGEVTDFVGGRADIEKKLIRAIGDPNRRFEEDRLRVLRALRFAVQLGFEIEPATWEAVKAYAGQLGLLAMERVQQELTKIFSSPQPRRGLELMDQAGLLEPLLPELLALKGVQQPPQFHPEGDCWVHTLLVMENLRSPQGGPPGQALAWAGLLHDIGKPATFSQEPGDRIRFNRHEEKGAEIAAAICKRLKMSAELSQAVTTLVADHLRLNPLKEMKLSSLKRLLRRQDFPDLLELHKADCLGSHGDMELYDLAKAKMKEFEAAQSAESLRPEPLLDGADLIALGYTPGPLFKEILAAVEDEQLEGRLQTKPQALAFVSQNYSGAKGS